MEQYERKDKDVQWKMNLLSGIVLEGAKSQRNIGPKISSRVYYYFNAKGEDKKRLVKELCAK